MTCSCSTSPFLISINVPFLKIETLNICYHPLCNFYDVNWGSKSSIGSKYRLKKISSCWVCRSLLLTNKTPDIVTMWCVEEKFLTLSYLFHSAFRFSCRFISIFILFFENKLRQNVSGTEVCITKNTSFMTACCRWCVRRFHSYFLSQSTENPDS